MKKLLFLTGTRADFGKLKPLMQHIEESSIHELHVLITGMHMMPLYGSTYLEVKRQGFANTYFSANQYVNEPMPAIVANSITIITRLVDSIKPDMIVVHGDRVESLAGAIVGALHHIHVCHIEGGELSGTIDDSIRHAITKLAHIHMVANDEAKQRLIQMGENANSIFVIGSPDLDVMTSKGLPSLDKVKKHYDINYNNYAIVLFHPVTSELQKISEHANNLFKALYYSNKNYIVIYPNNDTGSQDIIHQIHQYQHYDKFKSFPSVNFESFLTLLKHTDFIIGNSSAGVREAPFYGITSINIGSRQDDRYEGNSVINCSYDIEDIHNAIKKVADCPVIKTSWFGDGNSTELFSQCISSPELWQISVQKAFVDL